MDASTITVNVPEELQGDVANWQNGESYDITIEQTAPGVFNLVSAGQSESSEPSEETPDTDTEMMDNRASMRNNVGSSQDTGGTTIPTKRSPQVEAIIMAKRAKK